MASNPSNGEGIIYCAKDVTNGKCYIGQTTWSMQYRMQKHLYVATRPDDSSHSYFHRAIAKYGAQNFEWSVVMTCSPDDLDWNENQVIQIYNSVRPHGYNIRDGGSGVVGGQTAGYKRKRPEDEGLPKHITRIRTQDIQGYSATLPDGKRRAFTSKKETMQEKLKNIMKWIEKAQSGVPDVGRRRVKNKRTPDLPKGIIRIDPDVGYKVHLRDPEIQKSFCNRKDSMDAKLQKALLFVQQQER